ncbi:MAG TPA: SDR family oxidoreductase [Candidatus Saccharimonadales bacterium]|nr:SDR family oxidoreductase [Candidatus Saccharimonadales bacterium]
MSVLIVGGSSGLGLALAKEFADSGEKVIVTGRTKPDVSFVEFKKLDLAQDDLPKIIKNFVKELPKINTLLFSAGFYQSGRVTDLTSQQIDQMVQVAGTSLIYFMRELLAKQDSLDELITITSTSQWTPRQLEPIYNFAKAGIGQFSNAMAEDGRVGKVLVAGPSAMRTKFWDGVKRDDFDKMLDKEWVAGQIVKARTGDYKYKFIKLLRQPARVEEADKR